MFAVMGRLDDIDLRDLASALLAQLRLGG